MKINVIDKLCVTIYGFVFLTWLKELFYHKITSLYIIYIYYYYILCSYSTICNSVKIQSIVVCNKTLIADILICNANKSVIYMRNWNAVPKLNWIQNQREWED